MMDIDATKASLSKDIGNTELCAKVLDYCDIFNRTVKRAKQPGFTKAAWAPFAELVDVATFKRVGHQCELMNWSEYTDFVSQFAAALEWEGSFRRVQERGGVVYLELTERCTIGGHVDVSNTMTVYKFNEYGKLCQLDVYLQQAPAQT
jgi:hypothetical protein